MGSWFLLTWEFCPFAIALGVKTDKQQWISWLKYQPEVWAASAAFFHWSESHALHLDFPLFWCPSGLASHQTGYPALWRQLTAPVFYKSTLFFFIANTQWAWLCEQMHTMLVILRKLLNKNSLKMYHQWMMCLLAACQSRTTAAKADRGDNSVSVRIYGWKYEPVWKTSSWIWLKWRSISLLLSHVHWTHPSDHWAWVQSNHGRGTVRRRRGGLAGGLTGILFSKQRPPETQHFLWGDGADHPLHVQHHSLPENR